MLVYNATKQSFMDDVLTNNIENIIYKVYQEKLNRKTSDKEIASWKNSMMHMNTILFDKDIPDDCGVAIEYQLPQSAKKIDFILTGSDEKNIEHVIIIELKQWSEAALTEKDGIVSTPLGKGYHDTSHPSYQAWSYAALLNNYSQTIYEENIQLQPCAYLHNYEEDNVIKNEFYSDYLQKAPVFLKPDAVKLRDFIKKYMKFGDKTKIMYRIENGKIKPSKALADNMVSLLKGNKEFIMIDDQKVVYENVLYLARKSEGKSDKHVLIIEGGPGTGKSVVAVNLLVEITKLGLVTQYITKNAAPRAVYESKLTGSMRKSEISNMFRGSGSFITSQPNDFDVLIVDEAHRLNAKSGMFKNLGENQIKELINASKVAVFFIDENQKVTLHDIGEKEEIRNWAKHFNASLHQMELSSQFRCNGSDGYLAWLDNMLQIRETANETIEELDYDFRVMDSPNELRDLIYEKNKINNRARMVAGYCWDWNSKTKPKEDDIIIPEHKFAAKWNLSTDGSLWIMSPKSVSEIGCIHTCQGLELDYVGVIIGEDLTVRDGKVITDPFKRSKMDQSIKGFKTMLKNDPERAKQILDAIIKNTYRTLMTRGMKGCYVYFEDKEAERHFNSRLK